MISLRNYFVDSWYVSLLCETVICAAEDCGTRNAAARAGLGTNLNLVSVYADLYVVNKSLPSLQTFTNS